ncbi:MAG: hypothetical protein P4L53_14740 [Candidatus Obscuribacterales bacterium]|nr:hypothetical protein [Candidatus Obscuribacterales bacterium]
MNQKHTLSIKRGPILSFLEKPPRWFAVLFWLYPAGWYGVIVLTAFIAGESPVKDRLCGLLLLSFPLPLLVLVLSSRWFQIQTVAMITFWCILLGLFFDLHWAAVKSAVTVSINAVMGKTSR